MLRPRSSQAILAASLAALCSVALAASPAALATGAHGARTRCPRSPHRGHKARRPHRCGASLPSAAGSAGPANAPAASPSSPTASGGDGPAAGGLSQPKQAGPKPPVPTLTPKAPPSEAPWAEAEPEPFRFYSPQSCWNAPVDPGAPLDPDSPEIVAAFARLVDSELEAKAGPSINTTSYSVPIYTVPADQPTVRVTLDTPSAPALQEAWNAVPLPADAHPAAGSDGTLVVWQPSTDKLWDFWRAVRRPGGWHASWGGATQNVSTASGIQGPESWPGAKSSWGTSATSMGVVGGLITLEDLERGVINHALEMAIPNARAGVFAAPAQRSDGRTADPLALPEGAHLRLDPELDLMALHLPPLTLALARAAQRYGIFVTNLAANVSFFAQDPTPTGSEPYRGPGGFFEGSFPQALLSRFPWSHLQLLRMELSETG